jgi:hypothetical protein
VLDFHVAKLLIGHIFEWHFDVQDMPDEEDQDWLRKGTVDGESRWGWLRSCASGTPGCMGRRSLQTKSPLVQDGSKMLKPDTQARVAVAQCSESSIRCRSMALHLLAECLTDLLLRRRDLQWIDGQGQQDSLTTVMACLEEVGGVDEWTRGAHEAIRLVDPACLRKVYLAAIRGAILFHTCILAFCQLS